MHLHTLPETVGLWKHKLCPTALCSCVDDISVKRYNQQDLKRIHLLSIKTLQTPYLQQRF